jgi:hypothetical protein
VVEALGGALLGLIAGRIGHRSTKAIDEYDPEVLVSLALAMGGHAFALSRPAGTMKELMLAANYVVVIFAWSCKERRWAWRRIASRAASRKTGRREPEHLLSTGAVQLMRLD